MTDTWNPQFLESMRQRGDAIADEVVPDILSSELNQKAAIQLFNDLVKNDSPIPANAPAPITAYFEKTKTLPSWINQDKIKKGVEVFNLYGPQIVLMLFCKSLPTCYSCSRGAEVLTRTGRLVAPGKDQLQALNRRIMETAQFVMNVMAAGGLDPDDPDGRGIVTARKIRLIHGAIRFFILHQGGADAWDTEKLGLPINQEDMAGTLMTFSLVTLQGLRQLNIHLERDQEEGYLHAWNVVGYIIGLDEKLIPENMDEASALLASILRTQQGPSAAGELLTQSLIDYMDQLILDNVSSYRVTFIKFLGLIPIISFIYKKFAGAFPAYMIRRLMGNEVTTMLGLKRKPRPILDFLSRMMIKITELLGQLEEHSLIFRMIFKAFNRPLLQGLIVQFNDYKQVHFYIPPSLMQNWKLQKTLRRRQAMLGSEA